MFSFEKKKIIILVVEYYVYFAVNNAVILKIHYNLKIT